ncbi:MAG: hypothetical protein RLO50_02575 [Azospirillaceae bacterium]
MSSAVLKHTHRTTRPEGTAWLLAGILALAMTSAMSRPAAAQTDWGFSFDLYGWLPFIEGDVLVAGQTVGVDLNTVDILQDADDVAGAIFRIEGTNGVWGVWTDLVYLDLTFEGVTAIGPMDAFPVQIEAGFSQLIWETSAFYRVVDEPGGGPGGSPLTLDLYGGLRYIDFQTDITTTTPLAVREIASSTDWLDPLFGARLRLGETEGLNAVLLADIGGFGVGSEFAWQAAAYVGYGFALDDGVDLNLYAGYRALGFDYDDERTIDVTFHGPVFGASLSF